MLKASELPSNRAGTEWILTKCLQPTSFIEGASNAVLSTADATRSSSHSLPNWGIRPFDNQSCPMPWKAGS